jgi:hypothetical protein
VSLDLVRVVVGEADIVLEPPVSSLEFSVFCCVFVVNFRSRLLGVR